MRILFLGSPEPVVPVLEQLVAAGHRIVAVVTQPDRPAGRSRHLTPPPVRLAAERLQLPVLQPETLRDPAVVAQLQALDPELGVVAAYGQILRANVLAIPPLGYLNIHPSLLPLYRGPTPVSAAILAGDSETGVSVMRLDRGMDTGPILAQSVVPLLPDARADRLTAALFRLGAELLTYVIPHYADGSVQPQPQDDSRASVTRLLRKDDGIVNWQLPAIVIERMIRAFEPWPGCSTSFQATAVRLLEARVVADADSTVPGSVIGRSRDGHPLISTGSGALELLRVQPAGRTAMSGTAWWSGLRQPPTMLDSPAVDERPPLLRRVCQL